MFKQLGEHVDVEERVDTEELHARLMFDHELGASSGFGWSIDRPIGRPNGTAPCTFVSSKHSGDVDAYTDQIHLSCLIRSDNDTPRSAVPS